MIREGDPVKVSIVANPNDMNGDWAALTETAPEKIIKKRAAPAEYYIGEWGRTDLNGVAFFVSHGPFRTKAELQKTLKSLPDGSYKVLYGSTKTWKSESTKRVCEVE